MYHTDSQGALHRHNVAATPKLQYTIDAAHSGNALTCVTALSPDSLVVTAGKDGAVRCWDPHTEQCVARLVAHRYEVRSVAVSSSSDIDHTPVTIVASGGRDKTIRLWDVRAHSSKPIHVFTGHSSWVHGLALAAQPSPMLLSCAGDKTVRIWDLTAMKQRSVFTGHEFRVWSVAFSPDATYAISGSTDATVRLWKLGQNEGQCHVLEGHQDSVLSVAALTPACILSGCEDGTVFVWDCRTVFDVPDNAPFLYAHSEPTVTIDQEKVSPRNLPQKTTDKLVSISEEIKSERTSRLKPKHVEIEPLRVDTPTLRVRPSKKLSSRIDSDILSAATSSPQKDPRFDKSAAELVNALKRVQTLEKSLQKAEKTLKTKATEIEQLRRSIAEKDARLSRLQSELDSSNRLLEASKVRQLFEQNPRKADIALDYQDPVNKIGAVTDQLSALKARLDAMIATN